MHEQDIAKMVQYAKVFIDHNPDHTKTGAEIRAKFLRGRSPTFPFPSTDSETKTVREVHAEARETYYDPGYDRIPDYVGGTREGFLDGFIADSAESRVSWNALMLVAEGMLRDGERLPPPLASWLADVLADQLEPTGGQLRRPRPRAGDEPQGGRYAVITILIEELCREFNLKPTRNRIHQARQHDKEMEPSAVESACSIVAKAYPIEEDTVENIWRLRNRPLYNVSRL